MRIMRRGNSRKKTVSSVMMILMCLCINTACGSAGGERSDEEAGALKREEILAQDVEETAEVEETMESEETAEAEEAVATEEKEDIKSGTFGETAEQAVMFTEEDLPEEIRILLDYESWTDDTQAVLRTEEELKNSGMPGEFQQIVTGDFSSVCGLRNEAEREELKEEYEKREDWAYMTRDLNGDGIEELCIKDGRGRLGIIYEAWDNSYMPGRLGFWTFGDKESSLLTEKDWGMNVFFLNSGQFLMIFKSHNGSNVYYDLSVCYLRRDGTLPYIEEMSIIIINDTSAGLGVNYEKPGIYYEIDKEEEEEYIQEKLTEQEAAEWCEDTIYPCMMSEEEWYAVP